MKHKFGELIIIAFIVLMLGGMLASSSRSDTVANISQFESVSEYDPDGYTTADPFINEPNPVSQFNENISVKISSAVNNCLNWFYNIVKKLVS